MKFFVSFFVFLLCVVYSHQLWKFDETCKEGHPALEHQDETSCGVMSCKDDGTSFGKGCGTYSCANPKGYKESDSKKPYPECCGGPICD